MDIKSLTKKIRQLEIYTNKSVNEVFAGNYRSSFKGQGMEVSDLRKYEEGDDVRYIDWITTARKGRPYVKKFQESRELTTLIMVDLSASMNFTTAERKKSEVALELAATILFSAFKNSDKFSAILFSDSVKAYIPARKGKAHLLRILREIIVGFEKNKYKQANIRTAIDFLNSVVKKNSICFFVSDELSPTGYDPNKQDYTHLRIANKKHDFVFVNIFDQFEKEISGSGLAFIEDAETGENMAIDLSKQKLRENFLQLRSQKRENLTSLLKKLKIDFLELSTQSDIYKELRLFFKKRSLKI